MIKTFLTLLTSFSLVTLPLAVPNITQENPIKMNTQLSENETIRIAYESLDRFNKNDGKKTSEKEIICYESIYNGLLEEIGILATLKDEYAIIIIDNNQGIVIELGARNAMPYKNYDGKKVYLGPLNYYTVNNNIAYDVSHDKSVSISSLRESELNHIDYFSNELESSRSPQNPTPDDIYKYIYNYSSYFVYCAQPDDYSCVPTSFAMCLKYLNNRNKFALYNGMSNIYSMRNELYYNYMVNSNGRCREPKITNGFNDFCDDNTNKTIRCSSTWGYNCTFSAMKSEVDADYPAVLMFKPGADQMYSVNHATALVGYFKSYDYQTWTYNNYVRVVDPYASPVCEKTIYWNTNYIYGYYIITVY